MLGSSLPRRQSPQKEMCPLLFKHTPQSLFGGEGKSEGVLSTNPERPSFRSVALHRHFKAGKHFCGLLSKLSCAAQGRRVSLSFSCAPPIPPPGVTGAEENGMKGGGTTNKTLFGKLRGHNPLQMKGKPKAKGNQMYFIQEAAVMKKQLSLQLQTYITSNDV